MSDPTSDDRDEHAARKFDSSVRGFTNVEIVRHEVVDAGKRGARAAEYRLDEALASDVLELELQGGVTQWVSVSQLREDLGRPRSDERSGITIPGVIPRRRASTRGLADWVLKGLKLLRLDPVDPAADLAIDALISRFETKLTPHPGLYHLSSTLDPLGIARPDSARNNEPILVLVHGTASNTVGSFGRLASTEWDQFVRRYRKRVLGFEHHTLSVSPIRNALDLADQLPTGARLHFVSHSRGGLVGELIALGPIPDKALDPFREAERDDEVALLLELSTLLRQKAFVIDRFVRVACPARGTLLASERLDLYLSLILSVIGRIPVLQESVIYAFLKATVIEVASRRTSPDELPGLEAMMPTSLLINLLNRVDLTSHADLAVIAGDIEGEGILGSLKVFATDLFYRTDHDLVVNTSSMYGGPPRKTAAHFLFDHGGDVNHFNYFANACTRTPLINWLGGSDATGFEELKPGSREIVARQAVSRGADADSVVFLLPGLMATHLKVDTQRIWLDMAAIGRGDIEQLRLAAGDGVALDGLITTGYDKLIEFLQPRAEVRAFPFDWRKSVFESAAELATAVDSELHAHARPIRFIGHSMGGLVVRAMVAKHPELWKRIRERRGRLIMLGTPNEGTWIVPRLLLGVERVLRQVALIDFAHEPQEIADIFRSFPGLLEQLPVDCFNVDWWRRFSSIGFAAFKPPDQRLLLEAQKARERLGTLDSDGMLYLAGKAQTTPSGLTGDDIEGFQFTSEGDGFVTLASGRQGLRGWRVEASHGDLANLPSAFPAILDLLESGSTNRIHEMSGSSEPTVQVPSGVDREPLLFPTLDELTAAALGCQTAEDAAASVATDSMVISVVHGDLRYASYPVVVGHYQGDMIVSAEAVIDRRLGGQLTKRYRASLYPGAVGTAEVVHSPKTCPSGALVVGLGEVGEITPEKVRRGVRAASLRHALLIAETTESSPAVEERVRAWRSAAFSSLLLGTVGGSSLSIESSIAAVIQGAIQANHALKAQGMWERVRIDMIEFIELHEDLAIAAIRAARNLERLPPTELEESERIEVAPAYIIAREGGLFHRSANQYTTGWWRRIQITRIESGDLNFLTLTDRARAEDRLGSVQRRLVDRLVASAIESSTYDADLCATLYELLIPNLLKDQAGIEANLVLVLDRDAAQYPWELLAERASGRVDPFVLRQGLIRQFRVTSFRQNPQAASGRDVLIVGDTDCGQAELPGAQDEAGTVAKVLGEAGYLVAGPLLRPDALTVINELFARDYRVLHLAGHGAYNPTNPDESGLLLSEGVFLTAKELVKLHTVPDLVFLNSCHLARTDPERKLLVDRPDRLAASISEELIKMGVKAIVAAGWAVDDEAASTFADVFYRAMLGGVNFGDAVLVARQQTAKRHPNVNTWGAYQCYGNPAFTLTSAPAAGNERRAYYSRREVLDRIVSLSSEAKRAESSHLPNLSSELESMLAGMPSFWIDGAMLAALGDAWGTLGDLRQATDYYRRALLAPGSEATLKTAEHLVTLLLREARELDGVEGQKARRRCDRLYREAKERLKWVLGPGPTVERLALSASLSKQLAERTTGTARLGHLRHSAVAYESAYRLGLESSAPLASVMAVNCGICRWLAARADSDLARELLELLRQAESRSQNGEHAFEEALVRADAHLLRKLIAGRLAEDWREVSRKYQVAIECDATSMEVSSIREQIQFLSRMLEGSREMADALTALGLIEDAIGKLHT